MTVGPDPVGCATGMAPVKLAGMPVGLAVISSACHGMFSSGERIALPRPEINTVGRQIRELADEF